MCLQTEPGLKCQDSELAELGAPGALQVSCRCFLLSFGH